MSDAALAGVPGDGKPVKEKIHLLYLIGEVGLGGSEHQLYLLLKHLDKTLFDLHVLVFNPSPYGMLDQDMCRLGAHVYQMPEECRRVSSRFRFILHLARKISPHIIHSWSLHDNPYAGLAGWLAGVPVCLGSLRSSLSLSNVQSLPRLYRWLSLYSVAGLVVNSSAVQAELQCVGMIPPRSYLLPNCVEQSVVPAPVPARQRLIGMVANLRSVKNHLLFVDALARVLPEFPQIGAVIAGQPVLSEPRLPEQIAARIQSYGLQERVLMTGFCRDVPALLQQLEIFCLTSDSEGLPNAILEAMAAGLPVVATRVGGVPELVQEGINGLLVEPGDVDGLARALRSLLLDPQKAHRMGQAGRERVELDFNCPRIAAQLQNLYLKFLNQHGMQFWPAQQETAV